MASRMVVTSLVLLAGLAGSGCVAAETVMVPMRDGTRLATDLHLPSQGGPAYPVVLVRTVYGRKDMPLAPGLNALGMAVVSQDTRGHGDSEGPNVGFGADGWGPLQDGADTVAWVKSQPWCNGRIATWGVSALGITQVLMAPVVSDLACQAIIMAPSNFYDAFIPGGVPQKALPELYARMMGHEKVLEEQYAHPAYDEYWALSNAEARAGDIAAPAVFIGGWFDLYPLGIVNNFMTRQHRGGVGARGNQKLIMGPWPHGVQQTVGDLTFPDNYNYDWMGYVGRFFQHWLLGVPSGIADEPAVQYYAMGACGEPDAPGNEWRTADRWPPYPTTPTSFYLAEAKRLASTPATSDGARLTYDFDPADPCPTWGGTSFVLPGGPRDQRKLSVRSDVLSFATEPLADPLEIAGTVRVKLYVSTDAPDTDFTAKLVDIYPDGREISVCDGIRRLKFRKGFTKAEPLPSGEIGEIEIETTPTCLVFNKGHRIGVQISSSNYPYCELNPNTGEDRPRYHRDPSAQEPPTLPGPVAPGDFAAATAAVGKALAALDRASVRVARNTVYIDAAHPSVLVLPVRTAP